ncbi:hypothetical protein RND81_14G136000 [Saponaria officinalis]|uniref:GAG-pre-integrase domain-containing protein n=1 Tax=Saponaria officinalis TaxID=3572 RepID=A0AAW1GRY5_SAPOF
MSISKLYSISLPNGQSVVINYVGTIIIYDQIILEHVLFVPCFKFNLLSVAKLATQMTLTVMFTPTICYVQGSSLKRPLILVRNVRDLYFLKPVSSVISLPIVSSVVPRSTSSSSDALVWHNRLDHLPLYKLKILHLCNDASLNNNDLHTCFVTTRILMTIIKHRRKINYI